MDYGCALPESFNSVTYLLDRHIAEGRRDRIAVYYEDRTVTFGQLGEMANRLGNALRGLGVEQENRVLIGLPDRPEFLASYFGCMKLGAVPVLINTVSSPDDYVYYLNDSRAKVLIGGEELGPVVRRIRDRLIYLKHFIVVGAAEGDDHLSFASLVADSSPELAAVPTSRDDAAYWLYSSGTTGQPKGVIHLQHDVMYFMPPVCQEVVSLNENDRIYSTSKLCYSYGHNNSLDAPFLYGAAVVLNPALSLPATILETIERYKPTLFYSVPSSYAAILNYVREHRDGRFDLSSVRMFLSSGEALPLVVFREWKDRFGGEIVELLGSTDVGAMYLANRPGKIKPGSSGQLLPGFEARLVDEEGCAVPPGEIGVLWIKNDGCTPGYWNKHQKTKESINGFWFNTGDQFYQDADGYYWYAGRMDDMLKPGGRWVSPLEVENALLEHAAVREAAVVGARNRAGLEKPVAFVVLQPDREPSAALEGEVQDMVREALGAYKCPRRIIFTAELPRTPSGKIQRYRLRQTLKEEGPAL